VSWALVGATARPLGPEVDLLRQRADESRAKRADEKVRSRTGSDNCRAGPPVAPFANDKIIANGACSETAERVARLSRSPSSLSSSSPVGRLLLHLFLMTARRWRKRAQFGAGQLASCTCRSGAGGVVFLPTFTCASACVCHRRAADFVCLASPNFGRSGGALDDRGPRGPPPWARA
jgi:hypothetical protein